MMWTTRAGPTYRPIPDTLARPSISQPPDEFFGELIDAFAGAVRAVGSTRVPATVAGRDLELDFAGPRLEELILPPLRHLLSSASGAPFTIKIFDSASTGIRLPPPAWGPNDYRAQGVIAGFNTDRFRTAYRVEAGCLSMIDLERRTGVFWIRDPEAYPAWMRAAPLRTLLGWWASDQGLQLVHGAAVGSADTGLLLTAPGGAGKSTTALRCLLSGLRYAGDDYVLIDPSLRRIHALYATAKADDRAIDMFFPHLRAESMGVVDGETIKHVFLLDRLFADSICDLPLSAVAVPELTDAPQGFIPSGPAAALRALAPTTLFQLAGSREDEFRRMAELVRSLPIFTLRVSHEGAIAETVLELLAAVERVRT